MHDGFFKPKKVFIIGNGTSTKQIIDYGFEKFINDEGLKSIYGTSQEKSEIFHRQNQDIFKSRCAKSIERYTGVVYEHINWDTISEKGRKYMEKHILD